MGYELNFFYHEKDDEGKFNLEVAESMKKMTRRVGNRSADISLEQVAAIVMGQLARRDIYVVNVEVFEYAKKEVSFKETKNGIVIKGKKFSFDQLHGELKSDEDCEELKSSPKQIPQFNEVLIQSAENKVKRNPDLPMRHEIFRPHIEDYPALQGQGYKLTMNKPYPLFSEFVKNPMEPIYYVIIDDTGNKVEISSAYFEPMRKPLLGENMTAVQRPEGRLSYIDYGTNGVSTDMPVLRR